MNMQKPCTGTIILTSSTRLTGLTVRLLESQSVFFYMNLVSTID